MLGELYMPLSKKIGLLLLISVSLVSVVSCQKQVNKPEPIALEYMKAMPSIEEMDETLTKLDYYNHWKDAEKALEECEKDNNNLIKDCDDFLW